MSKTDRVILFGSLLLNVAVGVFFAWNDHDARVHSPLTIDGLCAVPIKH